jgi:hypothetical protein
MKTQDLFRQLAAVAEGLGTAADVAAWRGRIT